MSTSINPKHGPDKGQDNFHTAVGAAFVNASIARNLGDAIRVSLEENEKEITRALATGTVTVPFDQKGRIVIPAAMRRWIGEDGFYLMDPTDASCDLWIMPTRHFREIVEDLAKSLPPNGLVDYGAASHATRLILGKATFEECDKQGRMEIQQEIRKRIGASVGSNIVLRGCGNLLELELVREK